jgi:hypothetical protein
VIDEARKRIISAFLGLLIVLFSYIILTTINPGLIVINDISAGNSSGSGGSTGGGSSGGGTGGGTNGTATAVSFQEVPIGTLAEQVLARNITCFDKADNIIDCRSKDIIEKAKDAVCYDKNNNEVDCGSKSVAWSKQITNCYDKNGKKTDCSGSGVVRRHNVYSSDNSSFYCYGYDNNGDKASVLTNHDRLDCLQKMTDALNTKLETLKNLTDQLNTAIYSCNCAACNKQFCYYGIECSPSPKSACESRCGCCGGPRGQTSCPASETYPIGSSPSYVKPSSDPCINRGTIDSLREQIRQLVNGGGPGDNDDYYNGQRHYNSDMDPNLNPKFMTLSIFAQKVKEFEGQLTADSDILDAAEQLLKNSGADKLSLAEMQSLAEGDKTKDVSTSQFGDYDITSYCRSFNCTAFDKNGLCTTIALNSQGRVCALDKSGQEKYLLDGDPATFYFSDKYSKAIGTDTKKDETGRSQCSIITKTTDGVMEGLIPIGQVADYSRSLVAEINKALDAAVLQIPTISNQVLFDTDAIFALPEDCKCSNGCVNSMVTSHSCCSCCGGQRGCLASTICSSCSCTTCTQSSGTSICPFSTFASKKAKMVITKNSINADLQRVADLISSQNLSDTDPNRANLLNKLSVSRQRMQSCVSGYGFYDKSEGVQSIFFSSEEGMTYTKLEQLIVSPGFPYPPVSDYLNAYPFNSNSLTAEQRNICAQNFTGEKGSDGVLKCQDFIKDTMDDYYCCNQVN